MAREQDRRDFKEQLLQIPPPENTPAYRDVLSDPEGNLWVVVTPFGDGFTEVEVLSPAGGTLATVRFPEELELFEVGRSHILGDYEDAAGAPHVVMYRYSIRE